MNTDETRIPQVIRRWTPDERRVAIVKYDAEFARWQFLNDPLVMALIRLHRELTSDYRDVEEPKKFLDGRMGCLPRF